MRRFRTVLTLLLIVTSSPAISAQLADQDELQRRLEAKLESAFLQENSWYSDYQEALNAAEQADKLVLAYFTRSYEP